MASPPPATWLHSIGPHARVAFAAKDWLGRMVSLMAYSAVVGVTLVVLLVRSFFLFREQHSSNWGAPSSTGLRALTMKSAELQAMSEMPRRELAHWDKELKRVELSMARDGMDGWKEKLHDVEAMLSGRLQELSREVSSTKERLRSLERQLRSRRMTPGSESSLGLGHHRRRDSAAVDTAVAVSTAAPVRRHSAVRRAAASGNASSCVSCALERIIKYKEPLTPPDEPLKDWPGMISRPPSEPLTVQGSDRFYVLEALPDRCAGVAHKRYAMMCAVAEAKALGRQLAVHMTTCLSANHTGRKLNEWVPTAAYFDLEALAKRHSLKVVYLEHLGNVLKQREQSQRASQGGSGTRREGQRGQQFLPAMKVFPRSTPHEQLKREEEGTALLVRHLKVDENGFDVCHSEANKELMPLDPGQVPLNPHLQGIADAIVGALGGGTNFTAVHIRRGDKAKDHQNWPNLDRDTRPERLLQTLPKFAPEGTSLYIATNEEDPTFFHPLRAKYTLFTLNDFAHLWGPGSAWHDAYSKLLRSDKPELDVYMQGIIDAHVTWVAQRRVETFNDLTSDPRNGIHEDRPSR